jgi:hypothetical protein
LPSSGFCSVLLAPLYAVFDVFLANRDMWYASVPRTSPTAITIITILLFPGDFQYLIHISLLWLIIIIICTAWVTMFFIMNIWGIIVEDYTMVHPVTQRVEFPLEKTHAFRLGKLFVILFVYDELWAWVDGLVLW